MQIIRATSGSSTITRGTILVNSYPSLHLHVQINKRNTRTRYEICSELTVKTPERRRRHSGVFIVNFEQVNASLDGHLLV